SAERLAQPALSGRPGHRGQTRVWPGATGPEPESVPERPGRTGQLPVRQGGDWRSLCAEEFGPGGLLQDSGGPTGSAHQPEAGGVRQGQTGTSGGNPSGAGSGGIRAGTGNQLTARSKTPLNKKAPDFRGFLVFSCCQPFNPCCVPASAETCPTVRVPAKPALQAQVPEWLAPSHIPLRSGRLPVIPDSAARSAHRAMTVPRNRTAR